jgi:hypothetical protein
LEQIQIQNNEEKNETFLSKEISTSSEKLSLDRISQKLNQNSTSIDLKSTPSLSRFMTHIVTSPTSTKPSLYRRNTTGPGMVFPETDLPSYSSSMTFLKISPFPSPHLDKRFFDSSLVEMKSEASSSSTLDYDSTEEIWVRRVDFTHERQKRVSKLHSIIFLKIIQHLQFQI